MPKTKMARVTEAEWRLLRGVRAREAMTRRVLAKEAEARSLRDFAMERLILKQAEIEAIKSELAQIDERIAARMTEQIAEESQVPQI